jgi:glyoxylase-like metal-dependent hydrolase (beta-lactamase superfamily II)
LDETILPGLRRVRVRFPLGWTNAYLVDAAAGLTLVDTGIWASSDAILTSIARSGHSPGDVRHITVTHAHFDHAGSVARIARATGAAVWVHRADARALRSGVSGPLPTFEPRWMAAVMRHFPAPNFQAWPEACEFEDRALVAGDLTAIHGPGHTPGHCAYLWPSHGGVLFCGDTLTNWGRIRLGFFNADWPATKAAALRLAELDFDTVVFGHGPPVVGRALARLRADIERLAR